MHDLSVSSPGTLGLGVAWAPASVKTTQSLASPTPLGPPASDTTAAQLKRAECFLGTSPGREVLTPTYKVGSITPLCDRRCRPWTSVLSPL